MNILIVGGTTEAQEYLCEQGYNLHLITNRSELQFGFGAINTCSQAFICDFTEEHHFDELYQLVRQIHSLYQYEYILSFNDRGLKAAAYLSDKLMVKGFNWDSVRSTQNKLLFRKAMQKLPEYNIPFAELDSYESLFQFWSTHQRIVLKPSVGTGSKGVIYIEKESNLKESYIYTKGHSGEQPLLVEAYVEGVEYSVETFTNDGQHSLLAITDKTNTGKPHYVGLLHCLPSKTNELTQDMIKQAVFDCLNQLGWDFGTAHIEVKVHDHTVKIIEVQLRAGGNFNKFLHAATGINIYELFHLTMQQKLRHPVSLKYNKTAAMVFFKGQTGVIKSIEGTHLLEHKDVIDYKIRVKVGDQIKKDWSSTLDRPGYAICRGKSYEEAMKLARVLSENIKFNTYE
jgi:biotin carboxylase